MSTLSYFNPQGHGAQLAQQFYYSQAVRLPTTPPTIKIAGQGGWDPKTGEIPPPNDPDSISAQVDLAFSNVDDVLRTAGSKNGWRDVYLVRAYLVDMEAHEGAMVNAAVESLKKWCSGHQPVLTAVEVKGLALDGMRIEVEVEALLGE